ncbi:MAG TPA: UPF0182 family protein [Steroidobacteraceae bacterium]|nr:UPF0182 family protein [Steroidobacteraceae bacterium]
MVQDPRGDDHVLIGEGRRRGRRRPSLILALIALLILAWGASTTVSYYVAALWFESLGYGSVFWSRLDLQAAVFAAFAAVTFVTLYGAFRALQPRHLADVLDGVILINRQTVNLPIAPVLNLVALVVCALIGLAVGASMAARWTAFALWWYGAPHTGPLDPIFGRPLSFYFFTLPAWELITGWLLLLAVIVCAVAAVFVALTSGAQALAARRRLVGPEAPWRGLAAAVAVLILLLAVRVYLGRFERLFESNAIFSGVTYTDAHVTLTGLAVVCVALLLGALIAAASAVVAPRPTWLIASIVPAAACYLVMDVASWYVSALIVRPNQLVRERPFILHNIELTRQAYALDRIQKHPFPADPGIDAVQPQENRITLDNIRLWDWRALQDTLRQIQEIRTYYDFPDIDIDRYRLGGSLRQMMLAVRELNVDKLPVSSRTWVNQKLIYTHGYGLTMNPVNGFTPEGLPSLILSNMPVQSTIEGFSVTRPEIYFGELTDTDVYVKTHQKEFNYPQGDANNLTTYAGSGGIQLGGLLRRVAIAFDRGDLGNLPFSDDVTAESRLLMWRNIHDRVRQLAPFLTFDPDPYIVVSAEGRLYWLMDAYTSSDTYPYARRYELEDGELNYIRNSVKIVIDAYTGATTFYVFDPTDPVIGAYRAFFPALFKDASAMPADLREHVRYPEMLLNVQAAVYGLYHMQNPDVFYNREDLWSIATGIGSFYGGQERMEPNYVLMTLLGEHTPEFIEILPFTPANRNNLIGWIAGRSDGEHYGQAVVYDFPKTRLVDGPLQIEARIDQNAQLSGQLTLWNQQGSHVRRGSLIVIPIGRALLYAEPIYLQAERSPMPEMRLVVLAVQDRLAYGPTFESAMAALFGEAPSTLTASTTLAPAAQRSSNLPELPAGTAGAGGDVTGLISEAARDLSDYQQLTAAGKLGEAGQKLEALKHTLEELQRRRH